LTAPYDPNWANNPSGGAQPSPGGWQQGGWPQQPAPQQPAPQQPPQQGSGWSAPQQNWSPPQQPPQQGWAAPQQPGWSAPPDPYGPNAGWQDETLPAPTRPKRHGKAIAFTAAAVVLIGGGVATYAAVSSTDSAAGGSKTPKAAVQKMVANLEQSDLIGALDDLPPGERAAVSTPFKEQIAQLKRNDVIKPDANLNHLSGVSFAASGLTYDPSNVVINDHVQVVKLTDGTITVSGNATKLPFTSDFLRAIGRGQSPVSGQSGTQTVDIGDVVQRTNKPIRIAAQQVNGKWYPSLFYTIADNATADSGQQPPAAADAIPAAGASSADDAVRSMLQALLSGNAERAIELTSPDELQVLHDYGKSIVAKSNLHGANVQLKDIQFTDSKVSGGTKVSLKSVKIGGPNGQTASVEVNGSCMKVSVAAQTRTLCGSQLLQGLGGSGMGLSLTPAQRTALTHLFAGVSKIGVSTTEHDGKWYVNPVRSFAEIGSTLLAGLKDGDMQALLSLTHR
jgi:hypothetical protein